MQRSNKHFLVVNAFANGPFGGNPAAVFIDAQGLSDETMQAYARQLGLVETVFVLPGMDGSDFHLRYFTPRGEIPIAGHPSIAAWIALHDQKIIDLKLRTSFRQSNLAGVQTIDFDDTVSGAPLVIMKQQPARFLGADCSKETVAAVFALNVADLDAQSPICAVDTGLGHLIVPVTSLDALMRVQRQIGPLRALCETAGVREAQLFCFETEDSQFDLHTRNLCPREGLEDPACGVGNGALAAYLSKFYWPKKDEIRLKIEQGNVVQMPSIIHTRAIKSGENLDLFIGGGGTVMLSGQFNV